LEFSLAPLAQHDAQQLFAWRQQFVEEKIKPILLEKAQALVDKHRQQGDTLLVITATNRFVTEPIVKCYGIDNLIATTPEFINDQYTGRFLGTPCFQDGKVHLLNEWLEKQNETLENSCFYSDSHNDLPLLNKVDKPVAVDPDDILRSTAEQKGWPIISLR